MKKIILLALATLLMVGCEYKTDAEIAETKHLNGFNIVVIDSCEYLEKSKSVGNYGFGYFAHKGNCRFCAERKKQELEALVEQLKKK